MSTTYVITLFLSILSRPRQPNPLIREQALAGLRDAALILKSY